MIHIDFDPKQLQGKDKEDWEKWERRAKRATERAIKDWETTRNSSTLKFAEGIWGYLKRRFCEGRFHNKCAYCETSSPRYKPDAEHYRPKRRVDIKSSSDSGSVPAQAVDEGGQSIQHPGYFWLAYDWRNLIPSCEKCNTDKGKQNQFPVAQQHVFLTRLTPAQKAALREEPWPSSLGVDMYYLKSEDLDTLEQPLLLHPYKDDPADHLDFEHGGVIIGTSPKGDKTIEVCDLFDEKLRKERQRAQENKCQSFGIAFIAKLPEFPGEPHTAWEEAWKALHDVETGEAAYSAAIRAHVRRVFREPQ